MYGAQLSNAIASLFPFDVEVNVDLDMEDDLTITVIGATFDGVGGTIVPNTREYEVRGEITIPYEIRVEAVDEDDARDKAEDQISTYTNRYPDGISQLVSGLLLHPPDYTLNRVQEA